MKRFTLFMLLALLPASLVPAAGTARAQSTITLTYANFPPAATFPCIQMERWAKEVEKRTGGKVKVKTFPGGTLLNAKNMFEGVTSGIADIGNFAMSYQPGRFPVSEAVDLPLGFTSARVASLVLYDLIEKYKPREFEKVKVLTVFTCPPTNFMTKAPVRRLADLKGVELRVAGTSAEVAKRLGAVPVAMPQSETPEAIQKGIVKGMISSLEILQDLKFASYTPYATIANLPVVSFAVVMNKAKWDSLPADVKNALDTLSRDQAAWTGEYADRHVQESLAWAKKGYQHQVFTLPAADQKQINALLSPMVDDYVKKVSAQGLNGKQIVTDVQAFRKKYETPAKKKR
ncbi:TRAP transporter substrate-binding protein [Geobacter sulfurreducens]|jgi:TRAP-type C4-dicarboxylate transport system substrate-binding protein|uniref:TRAP proton/solute symporter, periplasmic substrate-binding protein n=1 Tax=Geobacter sulfurreducens (strain ATCC 51573 / DSM 12127 / PCA) TaxID=243231 RepID=Q74BI6_GEOSL|nr:TRAP transporter substrate-binding protein [Geobacter sulfurreducens]AAR35431.1 TRAP proton/solute symporter, periplasmic substrate-binding protein [Geobacter sulfurreducens PCA]ADI84888.1 TRAP proton/solute symporter, periplasmic substrate-binding protein [Geobacter sulfurreducens KN400]AJY68282.1 C4-dicarboxylate ABC transporter substrate-binding protein [Geobacter sulfurreducens]QVW33995.1 TRAP transporter substrate-binding protein [Geobacter sulfurreducens]UAC02784.1 TRAP transporter su